jgi:hypothetical protein
VILEYRFSELRENDSILRATACLMTAFNLLTHLFGTVGIDTPASPNAMEP